jgi:hypothetical protein
LYKCKEKELKENEEGYAGSFKISRKKKEN